MAEETIKKQSGVERQADILVAALERAQQNDGVLLNAEQKAKPMFLSRVARITPSNALVLAMHSDQNDCKTNTYVLYKDSHDREESVRRGQKSAPFIWTNINEYVNKENPEDKISRSAFKTLSEAEAAKYKVNPREEVYSCFNIDQTTMSHVHKDEYNEQVAVYGSIEKDLSDKQLRNGVNKFIQSMKENLVPIRKDATGIPHYDNAKDTLHIPAQKDFASYTDYVQEVSRQIVHVTGGSQRLGREGVKNNASQEAQHREMLVEELSSAHRMLELGLPAKLRPQTVEQLPTIITELKENPKMAEQVMHDVNRTVGMIKKAENGEKITLHTKPSEARQQAWAQQYPIDKVPQSFERVNLLKDNEGKWTLAAKPEGDRTFAVHPSKEDVGMFFDMMKNDHNEAEVAAFKTQFAQKYYSTLAADPSKEVNLFKSKASQEAVDLITKVNAFKARDNKLLLVATIGDEKQKPVEISQSQWQRMWLADDKTDYKTQLAAILYGDVLAEKLKQSTEKQGENEHREYHQEQDKQETQKEETKKQQEKNEQKQETKAQPKVNIPAILKQYNNFKEKHPDALLLFRCGDFYETYKDDAEKASRILGITLTKNANRTDEKGEPLRMAGFPYHALDTYLPRLIRAGERVAICDQLEPAKHKAQADAPKEETKQEVKETVAKQQEEHRGMHR